MATSKVVYEGDLRTRSKHVLSGVEILTDAPPDNQGKGEAFSPTDLMATSLANCMLTIMGIAARTHSIDISNTTADVTKIMAANPRRVSEIQVELHLPSNYDEKAKKILENAALTCPVYLSLHPDLVKTVRFNYPQ